MRLSGIVVLALLVGSTTAGCSSVPITDMIEHYDGPVRSARLNYGAADSALTGPLLPAPPQLAAYAADDERQTFSSTEPGSLTR